MQHPAPQKGLGIRRLSLKNVIEVLQRRIPLLALEINRAAQRASLQEGRLQPHGLFQIR